MYYDDGTRIPDEVVDYISKLYEELCVDFTWQKRDLAAVDNMIISHARRPYSRGLLVVARAAPVGGQEYLLGDVLGRVRIGDHTLGEAHDSPVVVAKEGFEGRSAAACIRSLRALDMSHLQAHHTR